MNQTMQLSALDGYNPLAFLTACGVTTVLAEHGKEVRLSWQDNGRWVPQLHTDLSREALLEVLLNDIAAWRDGPALDLHYSKNKSDPEPGEWDLKAPPDVFRRYLDKVRSAQGHLPWWRHAAAFAAEGVTDNSGKTKPLALHFTAGQQRFLEMVGKLVAPSTGVSESDLGEALFDGWRYQRELPVLGWDATDTRDYALRARNPSGDSKMGNAGADWLAFRALGILRSVRDGDRIRTTGCRGGWKDGTFRWPLWEVPAGLASIRTLTNLPEQELNTTRKRRARGVCCVLESRIRRSDQGGYGSFSPSRLIVSEE